MKKKIANFIYHSILNFAIELIDTQARLEIWIIQQNNNC